MKDENLLEFCRRASLAISKLTGDEKITAFIRLRYRELIEKFPHGTFSVEQGDLNFFETTEKYLLGEFDINSVKKSDYIGNYIEWIKSHGKSS